MSNKRAPKHLSAEAQRWWRKLYQEYDIDDRGGLLLLMTAMEAFDSMRDAQRIIADEGRMIEDRFGQRKSHPMCTVEKDSRSQMLESLKALNLDVVPLHDAPGRPVNSY